MAYIAKTRDALDLWWIIQTGSVVNRLSEVMDDQADGPHFALDASGGWSDEGGGIYSLSLTNYPDKVVYDLGGGSEEDLVDGGNGATPAEGEYGHNAGTLYIYLTGGGDPGTTDAEIYYSWNGGNSGTDFMTEVIEDLLYRIHLAFEIGDNSTPTTLHIRGSETVIVDSDVNFYPRNYATFQMGEANDGRGHNGGTLILQDYSSATVTYLLNGSNATTNIYGSFVYFGLNRRQVVRNGICNVVDSILKGAWLSGTSVSSQVYWQSSTVTILNSVLSNFSQTVIQTQNFTFNKSFVCNCIFGFITNQTDLDVTFQNFEGVGNTYDFNAYGINCTMTCVDPVDESSLVIGTSGIKYINYTINMHVADKDGEAIADSATVLAKYTHLVEGSDGKTYKCIQNHTAVDATHKPVTGSNWSEYWELYEDAGGKGDWETGVAYKSDEQEFSVNTTNGAIAEQTIETKQYQGNPHKERFRLYEFTISKSGYETLVLDNITIDSAIDWHLELQDLGILTDIQGSIYKKVSSQTIIKL